MERSPWMNISCVGFRVPAKPLRFKLWGAHEDLSSPSSCPHRDLKAQHDKLKEQETQGLYWFGPPMWCNTLLQCGGGGLPLGLMMNSTRGKNSLMRLRCSCAW